MALHKASTNAIIGHQSPLVKKNVSKDVDVPGPKIIDIRRSQLTTSLKDDIVSGMIDKPEGEKLLPTMILYSAEGLKLFEEITFLEEYYLTNTEIYILEKYAKNIAERIEDGGIVVELGSGNLRKVNILLKALESLGKRISYYALDLDVSELRRTLSQIRPDSFKNVQCFGLHGTYEDGCHWLKNNVDVRNKSKCLLWLGSSIGNFDREGAADFIQNFTRDALAPGSKDCMLIGVDGCKDMEKVYTAYNDPHGVTERFILEGLWNANKILGGEYFKHGDWEYVGEWNGTLGRHQAFYEARREIIFEGSELKGVVVKKGERMQVEYSTKFDAGEARALWAEAGLIEGAQWANDQGDYFLHMLYKPSFSFSQIPELYAPSPAPKLSEWKQLWAAWDAVTLGMIPKDQLHSKPIDLRNPCIFYLGHIPTFLDIHIARATACDMVDTGNYRSIFQRGIDPDVDDPEKCHSHSEIPDTWPALNEILEYTQKIRERTGELYDSDENVQHQNQKIQRGLWLAFEHEALHLETFLYMLLQSDSTLPPPGVVRPDFISARACERKMEFQFDDQEDDWVEIPEQIIDIGMNDPEDPSVTFPRFFGMDNEKPLRTNQKVASFKTRKHPITNEEYANYLFETSNPTIPASWTSLAPRYDETNFQPEFSATIKAEFFSDKYVKTFFDPVPLKLASDWPCIASYDELNACISWMGGRIPTAEEVLSIYEYVEKQDLNPEKLSRKIDAVNGHLINDGVRETPPTANGAESNGAEKSLDRQRTKLFSDLRDCNVGFKAWNPTSVKTGKLLGRGQTGGAWEWTSSALKRHEGFEPMELYPEYTADFFDGKHNIMLGGSWATPPRIAGRKSFANWYQRNYRFTWGTARIVKE
ncbi:hypothetical protein RUND412_003052 [Rhizina undulata]